MIRATADAAEPGLQRGPMLVSQPPARSSRSLLALWHLLSLDAPTVATVWTVFVARCAGLQLGWAEPTAMFVAVWMIYAADRLLDAAGPATGLEERHRFHAAGRGWFTAGLVAGAMVMAGMLLRVNVRALRLYALLAMLLGVWMLLIHVWGAAISSAKARRLPKEIAVGLFFPAAVFIPTVARLPWLRIQLLPGAALLAGVCVMNCVLLYAWEHPVETGNAHWTTRWAVQHMRWLAASLLLACIVMAARGLRVAMACGLSMALLWTLHAGRKRFSAVHLRALADLVLLTPLLWLLR